MIGPGSPSASNSGLGIVTRHIEENLKSLVDLTLMEPVGSDSLNRKTENLVTGFTEKAIVRDLVRIEVKGNIEPYHYFEDNARDKSVSTVKESLIEKELSIFTTEVFEAASEIEYDIIYAHDWSSMQGAIKLKEKSGKPLVVHIHSLDIDRIASNHKSWVFDLEKEAIMAADAVITVSNYMAERIQKFYDGDPQKIHVVYPGLSELAEVKEYSQPTDPTVLFLGRLSSQKGPFEFIEIAEAILIKRKDIHFLMVGNGDQKEEIVEQVAQKGLSKNIHFNPFVEHKEIARVFSRSSLLCMPSYSEPFGMAAVEAASQGIPVVISKQSGASEVLPGATIIDNSDIKGFAKAIIKLLDSNEEYQKRVEENTPALQKLAWSETVKNIHSVFSSVNE